jgi:hypothetical protein
LASAVNDVLIDEPVRAVLGIDAPSAPMTALVMSLLRMRAVVAWARPVRSTEFWRPGQANPAYPGGYTLQDVGPASHPAYSGGSPRPVGCRPGTTA